MNSWITSIQHFILITAVAVSTTVGGIIPKDHNKTQVTDAKYIAAVEATKSGKISPQFLITSGQYSYLNQTVKYSVSMPKTEGEIKGKFEGICSGTISGTFDGQDNASVNGILRGKCKLSFIEQEILGHFSGTVNLTANKVALDWVNDGAYGPKEGSITLSFQNSN